MLCSKCKLREAEANFSFDISTDTQGWCEDYCEICALEYQLKLYKEQILHIEEKLQSLYYIFSQNNAK